MLMRYHVSLLHGLEELRRRAQKRSKSSPETMVLGDIITCVRDGEKFSTAFGRYIPTAEQMILASGERAGNLSRAIEVTESMLRKSGMVQSAVVKGLAYPAFLLSFVVVALYMMARKVMPTMATIIDPESMTGSARDLYLLSQFVDSPYGLAAGVGLLALMVLVAWSMKHWTGRLRVRFDKLPPWSMYRIMTGGAWMLSLSAQVRVGERVQEAVQMMLSMSQGSNPWLAERLRRALAEMRSGKNIGQALADSKFDFPDAEIVDDLVSLADLGQFDETLKKLGEEWVDRGLDQIKAQTAVLNVVAIILVGILVAAMVLATLSMQDQITNVISGP
jgi:type II secretory pathway component PulF